MKRFNLVFALRLERRATKCFPVPWEYPAAFKGLTEHSLQAEQRAEGWGGSSRTHEAARQAFCLLHHFWNACCIARRCKDQYHQEVPLSRRFSEDQTMPSQLTKLLICSDSAGTCHKVKQVQQAEDIAFFPQRIWYSRGSVPGYVVSLQFWKYKFSISKGTSEDTSRKSRSQQRDICSELTLAQYILHHVLQKQLSFGAAMCTSSCGGITQFCSPCWHTLTCLLTLCQKDSYSQHKFLFFPFPGTYVSDSFFFPLLCRKRTYLYHGLIFANPNGWIIYAQEIWSLLLAFASHSLFLLFWVHHNTTSPTGLWLSSSRLIPKEQEKDLIQNCITIHLNTSLEGESAQPRVVCVGSPWLMSRDSNYHTIWIAKDFLGITFLFFPSCGILEGVISYFSFKLQMCGSWSWGGSDGSRRRWDAALRGCSASSQLCLRGCQVHRWAVYESCNPAPSVTLLSAGSWHCRSRRTVASFISWGLFVSKK